MYDLFWFFCFKTESEKQKISVFFLHDRKEEDSAVIELVNDIVLSMRRPTCTGLYGRKNESNPLEVASFLIDQLEGHESGLSVSH